jgi:hypothetical protein
MGEASERDGRALEDVEGDKSKVVRLSSAPRCAHWEYGPVDAPKWGNQPVVT